MDHVINIKQIMVYTVTGYDNAKKLWDKLLAVGENATFVCPEFNVYEIHVTTEMFREE